MGKTSWRGELEDREAEEEDSRFLARGKMGQNSALSFIIIPGTISSFSSKFNFEVFLTFNDCQAFQHPLNPDFSLNGLKIETPLVAFLWPLLSVKNTPK